VNYSVRLELLKATEAVIKNKFKIIIHTWNYPF